jgi:quinoprotein glucose dehydrogenase
MIEKKWWIGAAAIAAIGLAAATAQEQQTPAPAPAAQPGQPQTLTPDYAGWSTFNGDLAAQKYSSAGQITPQNVGNLKKAWEFHTGDLAKKGGKIPETYFEATPIFANNTVYIGTPFYRIFALQPDTGQVKWVFNPHAVLKPLTQPGMKSRGVAYWQAADPAPGQPCQKTVYIGTMDAKLLAVDADTGKACAGFGTNGVLDVNQWNVVNAKYPLSLLQPPTVYKDTLIFGWAGKDWEYKTAPPGLVFAVDARTGKLKWEFDPLPASAAQNTGTANVWASVSVDPKNGLVYLPVSSPSPNFYGGDRKEPLPMATSVTALDAETGKVRWSRQLVHHDVWDYDINSAPVLVDIDKGGQTIPALVQSTKMGYIFVLNRLTGQPIFPIKEVPVPQTDVAGEMTSPTQPVPVLPKPLLPPRWTGVSTIADIASLGGCSRQLKQLRYDGMYTPPSVRGSLIYPATPGGVEWGGGAVDPVNDIYVVNNSYTAQVYRLIPRAQYARETKNGTPDSYYDMTGTPYGLDLHTFQNWLNMPCWKPPYGSITAIDLRTGQQLWKEPFGEVQRWGFYMPHSWGSVTIGAPLITASGLIFIGASMDSRARAIDERNGKVLWTGRLDAPAVAIPASYTYKGKQYVVFVAGGNDIMVPSLSDQVVAFAL